MATETMDEIYAEVKRMRIEIQSLQKSLNNLTNLLIPEEKISPNEMKELKVLKNEALKGECVTFDEVLKKHGAKKSA